MSEVFKKNWVVVIGILVGMTLLMLSHLIELKWFGIVGLMLLLPTSIYLFLYKFKWLYYLMIATLPLSVHLSNIGLGLGLSLPGEGLLILVFIGVVWRMIFRFNEYKPIIYHPISLLIFAHLIWMVYTTLFSVLPEVSVKFGIIRVIYIVVFFVFGAKTFMEESGFKKFITMYLLGVLPIILFSLYNHYPDRFSIQSSNRVCYPFFNDHTIYAACIVMLIPSIFSFIKLEKGIKYFNIPSRLLYSISAFMLLVGLFFSYSRAGWLSALIGGLITIPLYFKLNIKWFVSTCLVIGIGLGSFFILKQNDAAHVDAKNVNELVTSITDTKKNHSNTERINRWKSALEMFKARPIVGFGPGTFMFVYDRYQKDKTAISVSDASMGGVHSEYLKPLSEQGFLGLLFFIAILLYTFFKGYLMATTSYSVNRILLIGSLISLVSYYIHGAFNFFLDTDKSSILFWGMIAFVLINDKKINDKKISR